MNPATLRADRLLFWISLLAWVAFNLVALLLGCSRAEAADVGLATYYTVASCQREGTSGVWTASGEAYDELALTCALRRRDFGSRYRVCRADDPGRCVTVRHNDFGPGRRPSARGVVVDLTPAAFDALGFRRGCRGAACWGEGRVTVEPAS